MIYSLKHLNKYLPEIKLNQSVTKALESLGFEVEFFEKFSSSKGLLFAKVLNVFDNPNSTKLQVVELDTKLGKLTIQTTNKVLSKGDLTICYPVGSSYQGKEFQEVTMQGYKSQGMLASFSEIGYDNSLLTDKDQILVLPKNFASLNDDASEKLELNDYIFELSITTNRNEINSYYFLAKELAAYYNTKFSCEFLDAKLKQSFESSFKFEGNFLDKNYSFTLLEAKGKVSTSFEEKLLLAKHKIDSKFNPAVNLTNLVLINLGIPIHVYDKAKLKSTKFSVDLYNGKVNLLGNKQIEVSDALVVFNGDKVVSLAATMGLEESKVDLQTSEFVFEMASFPSKLIRNNAKEIKMNSNASNLASKTITKYQVKLAHKFLFSYLKDLKLSNVVNDFELDKKVEINFDEEKLQRYSNGLPSSEFIKAFDKLKLLEFEFENQKIKVPLYRYDVSIFEDIIEELFRFYNYDNFKEIPYIQIPSELKADNKNFKEKLKALGYSEARTFTLVNEKDSKFDPLDLSDAIKLETFVSKEREFVRNSLAISLAEAVNNNKKKKINNVNLFEVGMVNDNLFYACLATTDKSFLELKQDFVSFFDNLNLEFKKPKNQFLHPNYSAEIYLNDQKLGWIGKINPSFLDLDCLFVEFKYDLYFDDKFKKYKAPNLDVLKSIDLTFELNNNEHLQKYLDKINSVAKVFEIKEIDDFKKETSHNVSLRITAPSAEIDKLNSHFNKD